MTPDCRALLERVMRTLVRHHPFDHDYLADEKKCGHCALLREVEAALREEPRPDRLPQMTRLCSHGVTLGACQIVGLWSGPYSTCRCCFGVFGYIDSATGGSSGYLKTHTWTPKDRCGHCGGAYEDYECSGVSR